jgi:hypothetical protein
MNKDQFNRAISIVDKYMNTQQAQNGKISLERLESILSDAETYLRGVFPHSSKDIALKAVIDPEDDFAGYELKVGSLSEIAEFDFGEMGIDIVE